VNLIQKFLFKVFLIGIFSISPMYSQVSVNSSGGGFITTDGSIEHSIGIVFYNANGNSSGSITQGVQHTYDITILGFQEQEYEIAVSVFPNPTNDLLNLTTCFGNTKNNKYQLIDLLGNQLETQPIHSDFSIIKMDSYISGSYILNILSDNDQLITSFKIIKY
jgi:hypothetical protein